MTSLLLAITVLFSATDGKLAETTAHETCAYLERLYRGEVKCLRDGAPAGSLVIALGSAANRLDTTLPRLADDELQVLTRHRANRQEILLRGGSPLATRAAAMRFLEQCGVLFGPLDDFLPDRAAAPTLADTEIRERPRRRIFGPHYWLNFPMDPSSFTREDWDRLVRGWSRMRATVMGYHFYQSFPWYDVTLRGFRDQSGYFFYGQRHPLAPEPELRYAIHNRAEFVSPEVEPYANNRARVHDWAQQTLRRSMALAHELGMKNSVTMEPFGYGVPAPYLEKMKEWNGGKAIDPKDRLHPLMREYVVAAIASILKTYPDLDILKLVSGESATREGTAEELKVYITQLVGGKLEDVQGRPVTLPDTLRALGTIADALTSAKLASEALADARRQGILRPDLDVAVGAYPGSDMKVHPALFALFPRVVPDRAVKLHFLPAHGMDRSAQAMQMARGGLLGKRRLEISGWTEFDGLMYVPQSCTGAIHRMNQVLDEVPTEALYAIQWRVASTTFDNAFFTRSQWDRTLTPESFWASLSPLYGAKAADALRAGMQLLETNSRMDYTFCYLGSWAGLLPEERGNRPPGNPDRPAEHKALFHRVEDLLANATTEATSEDGRRLGRYFVNKVQCAQFHCDYWREAVLAQGRDTATVRTRATTMLNLARQYLAHYQGAMLDRTDEGMLASYWIAAGQYAYRYAHPERYKESKLFEVLTRDPAPGPLQP